MSTKTEDVKAAKAHILERMPMRVGRDPWVTVDIMHLRTILASHAAQAERIASLEVAANALADLYDTDEGCRSLPQYVALRAILSGKAP